MAEPNRISRVILRNYKSIRHCDVSLAPITFLVGPNGAGKSNFVEALRFLSDGLSSSLEQALDNRSGYRSILHRGADSLSTILFDISFQVADQTGRYLVELAAASDDGPATVTREECSVESRSGKQWFKVNSGVVTSNQGLTPAASDEKLYLVNASGLTPFEPVYRALSSIAVYNPVPDEIRGFKSEKRYRTLDRTGSALAETIYKLKAQNPERLRRVIEYLRRINPSVVDVEAVSVDANFNLRFELKRGADVREEFSAHNISDGTLRALAVLVALFQNSDRYPLTLLGLEEPEAGLHPAAAGVLFDALLEGSGLEQVVVTSHSPDLLDREDIPEDSLKAVEICEGQTFIGGIDEAARGALKDHLYTVGELLRMDQLRPGEAPASVDVR